MSAEQGVEVQPEENPAAGHPAETKPAKTRKPRQPRAIESSKPSVGRIVRYRTDPDGVERAALITEVHDEDLVNLVVFNSLGAFPVLDAEFSEEQAPGSWGWPPRD